jgi:flagellar assembly factor FliW
MHRFVIVSLGREFEPFSRMQSLEQPGLEFIVLPPGMLFPDYVVEVDDATTEHLALQAEDAVVLAIVTLTEQGASPTVNLLGPLVVNRANHLAMQVVQHESGYGVAVPLVSPSAEPASSSAEPASPSAVPA